VDFADTIAPDEFDSVIYALGRLPHRVRFNRRRHQLKGPVTDRVLGVGLRGAADRHQRLHVFRMHDAPDIGLRSAHGNTGGQRNIRDLQVIAQHSVIRLHHVVIAVLRKFCPEPV
jgi:predicted DCC family thiol-disulfide oxidoreductase YuxK